MKKTRITDKITYVQPDSMANFTSCSGIMIGSKKKIWIDMNMGPVETPKLLKTDPPDACIITHYHLDHSIWTRHVKDYSNATVFIPQSEENYFTSLEFVIENTAGMLGVGDLWQDFVVKTLGYRELDGYECYTEKTVFTRFAPELVLIETPGHSPGHTSFYFPDEKILFSGDMGLDRFGPWYGWSDCSIPDVVESILKLDGLDVDLVLTSHGGVLKKDIQTVWAGLIKQIIHREKKIVRQLERGITKEEIISRGVFFSNKDKVKPPMKQFLDMWDGSMYNHHEALIRDGGLVRLFPGISHWD
ncbi:MAG: MBL fold metallo-hydrolase [Desulfobacula sp.]|nr:MBL fold metallo-hydrolase [Desulfobacula sp.]